MDQKSVVYKGRLVTYLSGGEGWPVVLLHGFGEDAGIWKNQYAVFPNHQLIVPNLPGSGGSELQDDTSMESLADAVQYIISQEAGDQAAIVIGHSMGGYVALALAEKYPDVVKAFGLFHSTAFADSEAKIDARQKGLEFLGQHDGGDFLNTTIPGLYADETKLNKPGLIAEQLEEVHNFSALSLVSYYKAMMERRDRTQVLRNANVPVLFVMGRYDTAISLEDGLQQCYLPPVSYIHILEKSGHMGMIEQIAETNKIFTGFVAGVQERSDT